MSAKESVKRGAPPPLKWYPLLEHVGADWVRIHPQVSKGQLCNLRRRYVQLPPGPFEFRNDHTGLWARLAQDGTRAAQHQNDAATVDRLVRENLRLVPWCILRYFSQCDPNDPDLRQAGNIGLWRAAQKFDPARKNRFATYAIWWIRQGVTRERMLRSSGDVHIPIHVFDRARKEKRRAPIPSYDYLDHAQPGTESHRTELIDHRARPDDFDDHERQIVLEPLLSALSERERRAVFLRADEDLRLEDIGVRLGGVGRERARQIIKKALRKMRDESERRAS